MISELKYKLYIKAKSTYFLYIKYMLFLKKKKFKIVLALLLH